MMQYCIDIGAEVFDAMIFIFENAIILFVKIWVNLIT